MAGNGGTGQERGPARRQRFGAAWPETLDDMDEIMDRMLGVWGPRFRFRARRPAFQWAPAIDVFEQNDNVVVRADVPGVKAEDIDVSLEGDVLTITGTRKDESEVKDEHYYRAERSFGEFRRSIRVPEGTKPEQIKATFKDGVLEVTAPKPKATGPESKKVKVEVQ